MNAQVLAAMLVLANVFGAGMIVPQALRLYRTRNTNGVSGIWVGVGVTMNMWWLAYATAVGATGLVPVSLAGILLYGIIGWLYATAPSQPRLAPLFVGSVGFGAVPMLFLLLGGWPAAGLAIGLSYGMQFAPAAISAWRADSVEGIAPATWMMALTEAAIWFAYGLAIADRALVVGGAGGTIMAATILVKSTPPKRLLSRRCLAPLRQQLVSIGSGDQRR